MNDFLDETIVQNLRETVNSTTLFSHDERYNKTDYNLICAVMDRADTCVRYLNEHADTPKVEEDFIVFLMFTSMLLDAIKESFKQLNVDYPYHEGRGTDISFDSNPDYYDFFRDICIASKLNITEENCPSDDKFYEYIRSLSFAHPVETSRAKFLQKNEIQYSPWVIANNPFLDFNRSLDYVGIRIYSSKREEILDFTFSFSILKRYIKSRYLLLEQITKKISSIITEQENIWRARKVNRELSSIEILKDIKSILIERHEDYFQIKKMVESLGCKYTLEANSISIKKFRDAIEGMIPKICDTVDSMDYEEMHKVIDYIFCSPKTVHNQCGYQVSKILTYLNFEHNGMNNIQFGLKQANAFAQEFAKKWVKIDTNTMSFEEIKLLVHTACYLEKIDQEGEHD